MSLNQPFISASSLYLVFVAAQAGLCLSWSKTPKTRFLMTRLIYMLYQNVEALQGGVETYSLVLRK